MRQEGMEQECLAGGIDPTGFPQAQSLKEEPLSPSEFTAPAIHRRRGRRHHGIMASWHRGIEAGEEGRWHSERAGLCQPGSRPQAIPRPFGRAAPPSHLSREPGRHPPAR